MSPLVIAILMIAMVILLVFIGVHIGFSLLVGSILGLWLIMGDFYTAAGILAEGPFYVVFDYGLAVIPLFVLMGLFSNLSGASSDLYQAGFAWFGRLRGGLGIVTVISNAIFAAVTGVSIASAAVFSKVAIPQMLRYGYAAKFSVGCVAGSSALGMLIPPSLIFIVFGLLANESIGSLFIAGVIPGILLTVNYSVMILLIAWLRPKILGKPILPEKMRWRDRFKSLYQAASVLALATLVLGGMYGGFFTPTEAGAVGCSGALILTFFKGNLSIKALHDTLMDAGATTASVFLLFIGAQLFGRMLSVSGIIVALSKSITSLPVSPLLIIAGMLFVIILMGTFLDVVSMLVIAMPIFLPIVQDLGFSLIWFGVLVALAIETGLVTPPFGMAVFVVKGAVGDLISVEDIYRGSFPFLLVMIITMGILLFVPSLSTWLPGIM